MKRSNLLILFIGVAIIFFGCTKDDAIAPDRSQNDQKTYLKAKKVHTHFTGESNQLFPDIPGVNAWYDEADDSDELRVTGVSIWNANPDVPIDEITIEISGTSELFVGAEVVADVDNGNYVGKWEITYWGTLTLTSPDGVFRIVVHAVGTGIEGEVMGMTAKWKYTMDFDGTPDTFKYVTKGKITKEF